jgi:hypothetical protein
MQELDFIDRFCLRPVRKNRTFNSPQLYISDCVVSAVGLSEDRHR